LEHVTQKLRPRHEIIPKIVQKKLPDVPDLPQYSRQSLCSRSKNFNLNMVVTTPALRSVILDLFPFIAGGIDGQPMARRNSSSLCRTRSFAPAFSRNPTYKSSAPFPAEVFLARRILMTVPNRRRIRCGFRKFLRHLMNLRCAQSFCAMACIREANRFPKRTAKLQSDANLNFDLRE